MLATTCVYRKPHPALISILPGKILCSCARIPCSAEINSDLTDARSSYATTYEKKGLATQLLQALLRAIAEQSVGQAVLVFPADQTRMLNLSTDLGFEVAASPADTSQVRVTKALQTDASH